MPNYAVLCHDSPRGLHWDLLLEVGDALWTWALPEPPRAGVEMTCEPLPDHRLAYLNYQGPVAGNRGTVTRWDRGTYRVRRQSATELVVELNGEKLNGRAALEQSPDEPDQWRFSFAAD